LNILPLFLMISWIRKRIFGERNLNRTTRGCSGRFKVAGNSRVPLVDAMNPMTKLISEQIGSSFGTDAANIVRDSQKNLENP
ncbi:hypothetical protein E1A91_A01G096100v1, partial [Gossypium mustelinum]